MAGLMTTFRLSEATKETLARVASERGMTRTAVVEQAIVAFADAAPRVDPAKIQEAIESLRAMKSAARKAGIGL